MLLLTGDIFLHYQHITIFLTRSSLSICASTVRSPEIECGNGGRRSRRRRFLHREKHREGGCEHRSVSKHVPLAIWEQFVLPGPWRIKRGIALRRRVCHHTPLEPEPTLLGCPSCTIYTFQSFGTGFGGLTVESTDEITWLRQERALLF